MKVRKSIFVLFLCMILINSFCAASVYAATIIDTEQPVSLQLTYKYKDKALTGTDFDIYLVAGIDPYGELTPVSNFESFDVDIRGKNDKAWDELTKELKSFVDSNKVIPSDYGKVDSSGLSVFPNNAASLQQGLYLVVGHSIQKDGAVYETSPFLVMLPSIDDETKDWTYEVKAFPKPGETQQPTVPDEPKLPQTGQLWWPVPIMVFVGLVFVAVGLIRRNKA